MLDEDGGGGLFGLEAAGVAGGKLRELDPRVRLDEVRRFELHLEEVQAELGLRMV